MNLKQATELLEAVHYELGEKVARLQELGDSQHRMYAVFLTDACYFLWCHEDYAAWRAEHAEKVTSR